MSLDFAVDLERELHPFRCHVIGHQAREHPDVSNTTHSDLGLEGAFLEWHLTTPSFYLYSFRKKKSCLVNADITVDDIKQMHDADSAGYFEGKAPEEDADVTYQTLSQADGVPVSAPPAATAENAM
eukprot:3288629-Rhodomonas_salina.1